MPKGFTLLELMVAISIVAIMATIGLVVFSNAQKNARDAKRKQDIQSIAKALESNKPLNSIYYIPLIPSNFSEGQVPKDPKDSTQKYCGFGTPAVAGVPAPPPPPPANAGVIDTSWTACTSTNAAYAYQFVVRNGTPAAGNYTAFTICAKLESVTNGIACVSSQL